MVYAKLQVQMSPEEYTALEDAKNSAGVSMRVFLMGLLSQHTSKRASAARVEDTVEAVKAETKMPPAEDAPPQRAPSMITTPEQARQAAQQARPFAGQPYTKQDQARGKR